MPGTRSGKPSSHGRSYERDLEQINPDAENRVGIPLDDLADLFTLDGIKGFGPQKFKQLLDAGIDARDAISGPRGLPLAGKTGAILREALSAVTAEDTMVARQRAARQIAVANEHNATILTHKHPAYPVNVLQSNNAVPVLYARGDISVLHASRTVACVGSRDIRSPYRELQKRFAGFAAGSGVVVVSGFALGADTIAHEAAVEAGGGTICVMPGGLDRPFPPENKSLFADFLGRPGVVFISEFPFGTGANAMNLRKRNKLIVAAARGVLVGQSSVKGGAMNAYRFGMEQRKPIATFEPDASADTSGNYEIGRSQKAATRTFPMTPNQSKWESWLSQL